LGYPWREIFAKMAGENRTRSFLGLVLMIAQAFFFKRDVLHVWRSRNRC
jgi:hypothetical protein